LVFGVFLIINLNKKNESLEARLTAHKEKLKKLELELEKKKIENLRFALNPHSFRNTLDTIEHLAKSTVDSVHSLSGIFDYMLYDATNQFVLLEQELKFAEEYLKLYRLRLKPTVNVKFSVDDSLKGVAQSKMIAPLITAHFIENAFKHGDLSSDNAFITIKLERLGENEIIYSVRNSISQQKTSEKRKGGLGKSSFQERLSLLYKGQHHLDYKEDHTIFAANLKLTLHEK
jgi:LytS/YehU family sensor histidine kinase